MNMLKRLVCLLVLGIGIALSTPGYADFQPDPDRWAWVGSSNKYSIWVDSKSITKQNLWGNRMIYMWVLWYENSPEEKIEKSYYNIRLNDKTICITDTVSYDMNGNVIDSCHFPTEERDPITPDSIGESLYDIAEIMDKVLN